MAEKKSIHEFSTGTPQAQTAFVVDTPSPSAESGYVTEKVITSDLGNTLLGTLNYTQSLDTESKNIFGAVNELKENSVNFEEEAIPDIPERELPYYPSGEYSALNTTDKHIVEAINEKQKAFKQYDAKITTNGSGFFNLVFTQPYSVISAWADQGDMIIIPFAGVGVNTNGAKTWWFRVMSDTLVARTNTTIDVHILYVD